MLQVYAQDKRQTNKKKENRISLFSDEFSFLSLYVHVIDQCCPSIDEQDEKNLLLHETGRLMCRQLLVNQSFQREKNLLLSPKKKKKMELRLNNISQKLYLNKNPFQFISLIISLTSTGVNRTEQPKNKTQCLNKNLSSFREIGVRYFAVKIIWTDLRYLCTENFTYKIFQVHSLRRSLSSENPHEKIFSSNSVNCLQWFKSFALKFFQFAGKIF